MNDLANDTMTASSAGDSQQIDFNTPKLRRKRRIRALKDRLTRWYVSIGGLAVLGAITLIFFYLAYVVLPIFQGASVEARDPLTPDWLRNESRPLLMAVEEQNAVGMHLSQEGFLQFFDVQTGNAMNRIQLPLPEGTSITSDSEGTPGSRQIVLGLSNGQALLFQVDYRVTYPNDVRVITPQLSFPFGEAPIDVDAQGRPLEQIAVSAGTSELVVAGANGRELSVVKVSSSTNLITGEVALEEERVNLPQLSEPIKRLVLDPRQMWLFVINGRATADVFDLRRGDLNGRYQLLEGSAEVTEVHPLLGGISLMVGSSDGRIDQWFMVRNEQGRSALTHIRDFKLANDPIIQILPEQRRKGFVALDEGGRLGLFHSTAERTLLTEKIADGPISGALSPRSSLLLLESGNSLRAVDIDNPHPEISFKALWGKVWYENYGGPQYVWQSTSANTDSEPKLSLAPLTFGTLKAAFYAMLLAAPLAICAAIYTAYFMAPAMRRKVKPVIELMEALPTVILGFFAGLFLAPYLEGHLPGVFSLLLLTPIGVLLFAFAWSRLPERIRLAVPDGWEAALLIPIILLVGTGSLYMSGYLENWLFGGNMRGWLGDHGINFDQRNALVVGIAMGFAVIPTIFSIAEDAVFSVPKSLTLGSLALGATPWQSLTRVVILTASPGIFSALMIGMGRAVGETMIVLMATGNTPIMDANIFEGMRTLAANVAVEMPESEVGSTHYRVLFLAALVLLSFTFLMNTLAEVIRTRLRKKYASL
ncbi:ABC transporter permease subunit [Pseudomonas sp. Marseille-QA0892]